MFAEVVWTSRAYMRTITPIRYEWVRDLLPKLHDVDAHSLSTTGAHDKTALYVQLNPVRTLAHESMHTRSGRRACGQGLALVGMVYTSGSQTRTRARQYTHTHTHTHARTRTHTHTHTRTLNHTTRARVCRSSTSNGPGSSKSGAVDKGTAAGGTEERRNTDDKVAAARERYLQRKRARET
jgi:hypothetical protein